MAEKTYTPEEQAQHRKEWVEALRSGKYEQTRLRLKDNMGYCCLGVACDISGLGEWEKVEDHPHEGCKYLGRMTDLSPEVADYFGIDRDGTLVEVADHAELESLIGMNDNRESFEKIAEFIEKGWVRTFPGLTRS